MHDYHAEIYLAHHLPDLHDVVFRHRADDPWLIGVPGKVRDLGCVTSVDELDERQGKYINLNAALIIHHHHTVKHMGLSFLFDMKKHLPAALGVHLLHLLATAPLRFYCKIIVIIL